MGTKISGQGLQKLGVIEEARRKWGRVYSLVEQLAVAKKGQDTIMGQIGRAATDVQRLFMNAGYGVMADTANQVIMLGKRGGNVDTKLRTYRELVTAVKVALEHAEKMILEDEKKLHAEKEGGGEGA